MYDESWVIVDVETSGLNLPVYVVEIAAQRMKGWQRDGPSFQVLINHNAPIEPMAEALHGYSREFLRQHGQLPDIAHDAFAQYCGDDPVVAYNIAFDWDRALHPEYQRLQRPATGRRGFCALTLARRTVKETENYKLETLKQHFGLAKEASHIGRNDVEVLTRLMQEIIGPRLYRAGIFGFEKVVEFSRTTPVAKCQELVLGAEDPVWFVLAGEETRGPYNLLQLRALIGEQTAYVCREGMPAWVLSNELPELASATSTKRVRRSIRRSGTTKVPIKSSGKSHPDFERWVAETAALSRGILADGVVTEKEVRALGTWLAECPCTHLFPLSVVAERLELILCDGIVTPEELDQLKIALDFLVGESH